MKLLIVDDHPGARALIQKLVARPGDEVAECDSGEEAVALARTFAPDWITVDLVMTGMNGFATVRALRAAGVTARVAIVSSYDEPEFRTMVAALGDVAFVAKERLVDLRHLIVRDPSPST